MLCESRNAFRSRQHLVLSLPGVYNTPDDTLIMHAGMTLRFPVYEHSINSNPRKEIVGTSRTIVSFPRSPLCYNVHKAGTAF